MLLLCLRLRSIFYLPLRATYSLLPIKYFIYRFSCEMSTCLCFVALKHRLNLYMYYVCVLMLISPVALLSSITEYSVVPLLFVLFIIYACACRCTFLLFNFQNFNAQSPIYDEIFLIFLCLLFTFVCV